MSHWRTYFDNRFLGWWDIPAGKSLVITIDKVARETLDNKKGGKDAKLIIAIRGHEKGFACNVTNAKAIAGMYGHDTRKWIGKSIALYATTTNAFGETVECIRVKPTIPKGSKSEPESVPEPSEEENPNAQH